MIPTNTLYHWLQLCKRMSAVTWLSPLQILRYMWGSVSLWEVIPAYVSHDAVNYECFTSGLNILGNLTNCDCYQSVQFSANPHPHWEALKQPKSLLLKNEWGFSHHYRVFPSILILCCHFLLAVKLHFKTRWTRKESWIIYCVSILHYRSSVPVQYFHRHGCVSSQ